MANKCPLAIGDEPIAVFIAVAVTNTKVARVSVRDTWVQKSRSCTAH